mgnify:FL=1
MQTRFTELEKTKNFVKTKVLESAALLWEDHQKILIRNKINKLNIEGKFGQAKRGFSLEKVMSKLSKTFVTRIELRSSARSQLLS